jgi:hypothetical protein
VKRTIDDDGGRRHRERGRLLVALVAASLVGLLAVGGLVRCSGLLRLDHDQVIDQGNGIVERLRQHHREHGSYPETLEPLEAAGLTIDSRWTYRRRGASYELAYGDYERDGFEIYPVGDGEWHVDR